MTIQARSIIQSVQRTLHDEDGTRWGAPELVGYLNFGLKKLIELRPDQKRASMPMPLVEGFEQSLPATVVALIDIPNNATGSKKRITKVDLTLLDSAVPSWRSMALASEVVHFMHNLAEPRKFDVYPPVVAGVQVTATVSLYPAPISIPDSPSFLSVSGVIDLPGYWESALHDYVLFRAYSKDVEFPGNSALAAGYYSLFKESISGQLESSATIAPKT